MGERGRGCMIGLLLESAMEGCGMDYRRGEIAICGRSLATTVDVIVTNGQSYWQIVEGLQIQRQP